MALAAIVLPAAASAGDEGTDLGTEGGLNYRVNVFDDFAGPAFDSFVACLEGDRPIAGGIDLGGSATAGRMGGTYPASDFGSALVWRSTGHNLSAMPIDMSFFAICRQAQPKVSKLQSATKPFAVDDRRTVKAACPDGFRVTGGGLRAQNPLPSASAPFDGKDKDAKPDDGWRVTAKNVAAQPDELTAYASCRKAASWDLTYRKLETPVPASGSVSSIRGCPTGVVTGGGGVITGPSGLVRIHETFPADDGDMGNTPADGWFTSLRNGGMESAAGVFHAICRT